MVFKHPGVVKIFCNIHPHMIATIVVVENDKYAMTDAQGRFTREGIPPGSHQLHVWAEGKAPQDRAIEVKADSKESVEFKLTGIRK